MKDPIIEVRVIPRGGGPRAKFSAYVVGTVPDAFIEEQARKAAYRLFNRLQIAARLGDANAN